MNLPNQFSGPRIIHSYMQPTKLFSPSVCLHSIANHREQQIEQIGLEAIHHTEILSLDRETVFTELVNRYLSDEDTDYPVLDIDRAKLHRGSSQTTVKALYSVPYSGAEGSFSFKPASEYDPPSNEVTIHRDQVNHEITFYYELTLQYPEENFEERLQALLKNDLAWVVNSLDDVIRHFRVHDTKLMGIMHKALEQRVAAVSSIEGQMERIMLPEEIFEDKRSVMRGSSPQPGRGIQAMMSLGRCSLVAKRDNATGPSSRYFTANRPWTTSFHRLLAVMTN